VVGGSLACAAFEAECTENSRGELWSERNAIAAGRKQSLQSTRFSRLHRADEHAAREKQRKISRNVKSPCGSG